MTISHPARAAEASCLRLPAARQAEPPRTLTALMAQARAAGTALHLLDADAETLGLILPTFSRVAATTGGPHALISERGGYGPMRLAGQRHVQPSRRIGLRLTSGRGERLVMGALDVGTRKPAALHLFGPDGHLRHRMEIAAPEDLLLLAALCGPLIDHELTEMPDDAATDPPAPPVSIPLIRRAQAEWQGMDEAAHLDDLLLDGGPGRAACLRHLGPDLARPVPPARIAAFLAHLAGARLAFRRIVLRPGCLQAHSGAAERMPGAGSVMVLRSKASLFALDMAALAHCWLTQWETATGPAAVIELYDRHGQCLAVLTGREKVAKEAALWNRLAGLLPGG